MRNNNGTVCPTTLAGKNSNPAAIYARPKVSSDFICRCALVALIAPSVAFAQPGFYESEPNNTPQEANPVSGEVVLYGTMVANDQDGFLWTVTDEDARKRWNFELHGIPGALTIVDLSRVEYTEDGEGVAGVERLMKMGTRDGVTPSIHRNQLFDPGEYLIGLAYGGAPRQGSGGGMLRLKPVDVSFGQQGTPETSGEASADAPPQSEVPAPPGAYRLLITEGDRMSVSRNPGPSETREAARPVRLGRGIATFEPLETAWYSFTFDGQAATQRWDIEVRAPIGRPVQATLRAADGTKLADRKPDNHGRILFSDLAPEATTWFLELTTKDPGFIHWVGIESVGQRVAGEEAEPNDTIELANRVDFSQPVTGRIGGDDRADYFRFSLDEQQAEQMLALRIESTPPVSMRFCLLDHALQSVQCRSQSTPVELPALVLTPGDWGVYVGRAKETEYTISLLTQGPIEAGMEAEPNDTVETAAGVPSN
jgi:hypothetical protein